VNRCMVFYQGEQCLLDENHPGHHKYIVDASHKTELAAIKEALGLAEVQNREQTRVMQLFLKEAQSLLERTIAMLERIDKRSKPWKCPVHGCESTTDEVGSDRHLCEACNAWWKGDKPEDFQLGGMPID
jgi:hypothetical protein